MELFCRAFDGSKTNLGFPVDTVRGKIENTYFTASKSAIVAQLVPAAEINWLSP